MTFSFRLFIVRLQATVRAGCVALVLCAVTGAFVGSGDAASLLPGEALCGLECDAPALPPELSDTDTVEGRPLWRLRFTDDAVGTFLGDYAPDVSPLGTPPDRGGSGDGPSEGIVIDPIEER